MGCHVSCPKAPSPSVCLSLFSAALRRARSRIATAHRIRTPPPHTVPPRIANAPHHQCTPPSRTAFLHRHRTPPSRVAIACRHRVSPSRVAIACRHRVSPSRTTPARHTRCPQRTRKRRPAERQTGRRRELLSGDGPASALRGDARSVEHLALHLHEVLLPGGVLTGGDDALQRCRGHEQSDDRRRWRRLICTV